RAANRLARADMCNPIESNQMWRSRIVPGAKADAHLAARRRARRNAGITNGPVGPGGGDRSPAETDRDQQRRDKTLSLPGCRLSCGRKSRTFATGTPCPKQEVAPG